MSVCNLLVGEPTTTCSFIKYLSVVPEPVFHQVPYITALRFHVVGRASLQLRTVEHLPRYLRMYSAFF